MNDNIEVAIYLNKLKSFFDKDKDALTFLLNGGNIDILFTKIQKISKENMKNIGDPTLTKEQFEKIRSEMVKGTMGFDSFSLN